MGKKPDPELYEYQVACLAVLEPFSEQGLTDLYYGDESGVSTQGYCPYAWQGKEEKISVAALLISRQRLNCFGCTRPYQSPLECDYCQSGQWGVHL